RPASGVRARFARARGVHAALDEALRDDRGVGPRGVRLLERALAIDERVEVARRERRRRGEEPGPPIDDGPEDVEGDELRRLHAASVAPPSACATRNVVGGTLPAVPGRRRHTWNSWPSPSPPLPRATRSSISS